MSSKPCCQNGVAAAASMIVTLPSETRFSASKGYTLLKRMIATDNGTYRRKFVDR
jgi:hypothetical protein